MIHTQTSVHTPVPSQNLSCDAELSVPPQVSQEAGCCQALSYPNHPNPTYQVTSWLLVVQSVQRLPPVTPGWRPVQYAKWNPFKSEFPGPVLRSEDTTIIASPYENLQLSNFEVILICLLQTSLLATKSWQWLKNVARCFKQPVTWDEHAGKSKRGTGSSCCQMVFVHAIESQKVQRCVLRKTRTYKQSQSGRIQWYNAHEAATHGKATWISCHPTGKLTAQSRKVYPSAVCHVPVVLVALDRSHVSLVKSQRFDRQWNVSKRFTVFIHSNFCTVYISNSFQFPFYWQPKTRSNSDLFWHYEFTELK